MKTFMGKLVDQKRTVVPFLRKGSARDDSNQLTIGVTLQSYDVRSFQGE